MPIVFAVLGYFAWFIAQSAARLSLLAELGDPFAFVAQWFGPAGTPLGLRSRAGHRDGGADPAGGVWNRSGVRMVGAPRDWHG